MKTTGRQQNMRIRDLNFRLIFYVILLSVIGIFVVNSATANEKSASLISTTVKQIVGVFGGIVAMIILAQINYRYLVKYAWVFYLLAVGSLTALLIFGKPIYGATRWFHIPLLGTIQPSEFAKPALLLALAFVVRKIGSKINRFYMILLYLAVASPVLLLILKEPDLSTSIVIIMLILIVMFLGGISYKWILAVIAAMIPLVVLFFVFLYQPGQTVLMKVFEEHQIGRINAFFFPDQYPGLVYQQNTSVMAIGSGGLFGKGLNNSSLESVKNGNFLSEEQCDFIFAVVGEELGFVGSAGIIALIGLISTECFLTARKCSDATGKILAGGVGGVLAIQSFINIAVAVLLIPNTGIPLPFVSAGLSSLLSSYIMVGLVLSVSVFGRSNKRKSYL